MDYMTRVKKCKEDYKADIGHANVLPDAWMINFFIEWEKTTNMVKEGARKKGIDLNFIYLTGR